LKAAVEKIGENFPQIQLTKLSRVLETGTDSTRMLLVEGIFER